MGHLQKCFVCVLLWYVCLCMWVCVDKCLCCAHVSICLCVCVCVCMCVCVSVKPQLLKGTEKWPAILLNSRSPPRALPLLSVQQMAPDCFFSVQSLLPHKVFFFFFLHDSQASTGHLLKRSFSHGSPAVSRVEMTSSWSYFYYTHSWAKQCFVYC
jgi:hypothetical protein